MSIMCLILFTSPSNTPLNPPAHPPFNFRSSFYLYNSMSPVGTSHGAWVQGQLLDDGQPMTTHGEKDDCAFSNSCGPLSGTWAQQLGQAIEFQEPTVSTSTALGLQVQEVIPGSSMGSGESNSGPHTHTASTLPIHSPSSIVTGLAM